MGRSRETKGVIQLFRKAIVEENPGRIKTEEGAPP